MAEPDLTFGFKKEILRKIVHLSAVVALFADLFFTRQTIVAIGTVFCVAYLTAEYFRFKRERVTFITDMIKFFARGNEIKEGILTPFYIIFAITLLYGISGILISGNAVHVAIIAVTFWRCFSCNHREEVWQAQTLDTEE